MKNYSRIQVLILISTLDGMLIVVLLALPNETVLISGFYFYKSHSCCSMLRFQFPLRRKMRFCLKWKQLALIQLTGRFRQACCGLYCLESCLTYPVSKLVSVYIYDVPLEILFNLADMLIYKRLAI